MLVSFEDVKICPACGLSGESKRGGRLPSASRGTSTLHFTCKNTRCKWYNTGWIVEVMPDGTIHPPNVRRQKEFPSLPREPEGLVSNLQHLHQLMLAPGAEWPK